MYSEYYKDYLNIQETPSTNSKSDIHWHKKLTLRHKANTAPAAKNWTAPNEDLCVYSKSIFTKYDMEKMQLIKKNQLDTNNNKKNICLTNDLKWLNRSNLRFQYLFERAPKHPKSTIKYNDKKLPLLESMSKLQRDETKVITKRIDPMLYVQRLQNTNYSLIKERQRLKYLNERHMFAKMRDNSNNNSDDSQYMLSSYQSLMDMACKWKTVVNPKNLVTVI